MNILMHTCCAPCSVMCIDILSQEGITPDLFWYNPNIHPYTEYNSRQSCLELYSQKIGCSLISDDHYGLREFLGNIEPGKIDRRCVVCYGMRLKRTAMRAARDGYDFFTTTLLVSPYQNHELIAETAEKAAAEYGISFLYKDFRPYFREGQKRAREEGLYMQKYCGCIFSEEERYLATNKK